MTRVTSAPSSMSSGSHSSMPMPRPNAASLPATGPPTTSSNAATALEAYHPGTASGMRRYRSDASLVLVGMRGTGMSSLGVMASSALGFRLVDADQHFFQVTGLSRAAFKSVHGSDAYSQEELRLMRSMLADNALRSILVCGPGCVKGPGRLWLSEYAREHPVIFVLRDTDGIQEHLKLWDVETIQQLVRLSSPIHRALSSYEFYNLSEPPSASPDSGSPRSLTLKQAERDFLRLLQAIVADNGDTRLGQAHSLEDGSPALAFAPGAKAYTYALTVPLPLLQEVGPSLRKEPDMSATADAVELVIPFPGEDAIFDHNTASSLTRQYYVARRTICLPVVAFVDIGHVSKLQESVYFDLLDHLLRLAPEYLCVDLGCDKENIRRLVAAKGATKIIGHYTVTSPGDNGWDETDREDQVWLADDLGCDAVRLCQSAQSLADNHAAQQFVRRVQRQQTHHCATRRAIPIIAYNTGHLGRMSCFLNRTLSPVTHPLLEEARTKLANSFSPFPLIALKDAQRALYSAFMLDPMIFGIYGSRAASSLSPAMHNPAFEFCGMPHTYTTYEHPTLRDLEALVCSPRFGGLSITAPFKRDIIPLLGCLSHHARAIGAVNTIIPLQGHLHGRGPTAEHLLDRNRANHEDGPVTLYGENTDWIGLLACIRRNLSPINAVRRRTTALVLGAGGMARASTYALLRLGVQTIFVQNRTVAKAEDLAVQFTALAAEMARGSGKDVADAKRQRPASTSQHQPNKPTTTVRVIPSFDSPWPDGHDPPTIIVSCIPHNRVDGQSSADRRLPTGWLTSPTGGVVIELAYMPLQTALLRQAQDMSDHGWISIDGLQVLPEQGAAQFELFTGRRAPRELMRREVLKAYHSQEWSSE